MKTKTQVLYFIAYRARRNCNKKTFTRSTPFLRQKTCKTRVCFPHVVIPILLKLKTRHSLKTEKTKHTCVLASACLSVCQSINQSNNRSINQSINLSMNESTTAINQRNKSKQITSNEFKTNHRLVYLILKL